MSITPEEFERYKRFQAEQYKELGVQVAEIKKMLESYTPMTPIAPRTKDLLARQVELMFKRIQFVEREVMNLKNKNK